MENERIFLSGKTVSLSEDSADKTYLTLINRVCFYGMPNLNNVLLPSDTAEEKAQTLLNQPVQAKYKLDKNGLPTLGGHEAYIDENGDVAFGTESVGTHTRVWIENDDVDVNGEVLNLPCLFAELHIWTRHKNVCEAIKRLYSADGGLHNSWEIITKSYTYANNIKTLTDYVFFGNCLLGDSHPAYGKDAKILSISSSQSNLLIAEACAKDMIESSANIPNDTSKGKEAGKGENMEKTIEEIIKILSSKEPIDFPALEESLKAIGVTFKDSEGNYRGADAILNDISALNNSGKNGAGSQETSALTVWDLWGRVDKACRLKYQETKSEDSMCWLSFLFPVEQIAWCTYCGAPTELDMMEFKYTVSGEEVSVNDAPVAVQLTASPRELSAKLAEKDETIIQMNKEISDLKASLSAKTVEYDKVKASFDELYQKVEKEAHDARVAELKQYVLDSECFTEKDLEQEEIASLIESLDKAKLQMLISDKIVENRRKGRPDVETSSKDNKAGTGKPNITVDLNVGANLEKPDPLQIMSEFLNN